MNDWDKVYAAGAIAFLTGRDPYAYPWTFASPPWSLLFLAPLSWVPPQAAMLFPIAALLFLAVRRKKPLLLLVVGTSFPFIAGSVYANIDWIVMLGVAIGGPLGVILDTFKPQAGLFAALAEVARRKRLGDRIWLLLPLAILVVLTVPLLSSWWYNMSFLGGPTNKIRNFSLFPYTIPLGLLALYLTWRREDPLWGVVASLCLSPYFYIHSLIPLVYLLADRNWRWGLLANAATWGIVGLILVGLMPIKL